VKKKRSRKKSSKKQSARSAKKSSAFGVRNKPLSTLTDEALRGYFTSLNGHRPGDLYQLVMTEVERPLLKTVMLYTNGNQSEAAEILGINRGTLRKKLKHHDLLSG